MENHVEAHRKVKRRKVVHDAPEAAIRSAGDLHRLLTSQEEIRTAIQLFKEFLLEIPQLVDNEGRAKRLQILKVYSEEQLSLNQQASTFPDLISAWTAAVESNNESILSSVPSVLALYLKTVSSLLDFRDIGLSLCRSLLFKDHLRLFDRGLTATKTKEHLISPCLRLLTEIVSFDGGEVAGLVYSKRDTTFRRLELFLDQRAPSATGSADVRQKPTLRRIAQRYLLANLKFQSASAKGDIIAQGKILKSCTQNLRSDGADIIRDVLTCLENDIIKADSLTKSIKNRLFDYSTLCSLSKLYTFHEEANEVSTSKSIRDHVDDVLRLICTVEETGILLPQNGWYPPGSKSEKTPGPIADSDTIETGVDSALSQQQKNRFGVKNVVLSTFIQGLRPDTDSLQASLLLDIFRAAPELVADYFAKKNNFIVEPKDTPAWLGQSAFLFSTIQLPVPDYCGWRGGYAELPPPSPAVLESILPRPLDRMVTTRCLNINHEVITLFAIRALTVAFQKLSRVLETYNAATHDSDSWRQAASDLLMSFSQRCPLAKDVLTTLQRTPQSDEQLRGAIFELIAKYHQVLPQLMLVEKFDISLSLVDAIKRVESDLTGASLKPLRFAELENLLAIAQMSLDTKWWQKPDSLHFSAFTSMLKAVLDTDPSILAVRSIKRLLNGVLVEHGILPSEPAYFDALVTSLTPEEVWLPSTKTINFFDSCASRIARQPVHYEDLAAELDGNGVTTCLLPICIAEQWPFVLRDQDLGGQENVGEWIMRLLVLLKYAGENPDVLTQLSNQIVNATNDAALKQKFRKAYERRPERTVYLQKPEEAGREASVPPSTTTDEVPAIKTVLQTAFEQRPRKVETIEGLERLYEEDLEELIADRRLARLCRSLSSPAEETRRQALVTLQRLTKQIELSNYSEKGPLFVLMGELVETAKLVGLTGPLAAVVTEFAAAAIEMLDQPSHAMYGKINKFLQKGPSWNVSKLVGYWIEKIMLREPEDDHGHFQEMFWLLTLLNRGLQDVEDMELYRRANVFERLLAFYSSTLCSDTHRMQILELVYSAIKLGCGMTLISRTGIESWFEIESLDGRKRDVIAELGSQLQKSVESKAVHWKLQQQQQQRSPTSPSRLRETVTLN